MSSQEELGSLFGRYHPDSGIVFLPDGDARDMLLIDSQTHVPDDYFPADSTLTEEEKAVEFLTRESVAQARFKVTDRSTAQTVDDITATVVAGDWSLGRYVMGVEFTFAGITSFGMFVPLQIEDDYDLIVASMDEVGPPLGDGGFVIEEHDVPPDRSGGVLPPLTGRGTSDGGCDAVASACRDGGRADNQIRQAGCKALLFALLSGCVALCSAAFWGGPWFQIACGVLCTVDAALIYSACVNASRAKQRADMAMCWARRGQCCNGPNVVCTPPKK